MKMCIRDSVKALANERDVPLYLIKATSLIGEHVGDSATAILTHKQLLLNQLHY